MSLSVPCTPQKYQEAKIGEEHCGVKLRDSGEEMRKRQEQFPLPLLIRASGNPPFVRLIKPSAASVDEHCVYLLASQKRLIIYNGHEAAIICRSKIAQMAFEIVASKEWPTSAVRVEIANDDQKTECHFWSLLKRDEENEAKAEKENLRKECREGKESFEEDKVFEMRSDGTTALLSEGQPPEIAMLDRGKVLIFYFISEIYVWVGSEADKSLIENGVNFARSFNQPNVGAKRIVCQNDHSSPMNWTILRRISEGIVDTLFKYKFGKWTSYSAKKKSLLQRPKSVCAVPCAALKIANENALIKETAHKMTLLRSNGGSELKLEDNLLRPEDDGVFTEARRIYEVVEESLRESDGRGRGTVMEFKADKCYVVEWEYRIERKGIRKLDGSVAQRRECGRRRKCFFYWLGPRSTVAEQSRCALALREKDTERCEHIRVEAGKEAPMFLHILGGLIVWGTGSNILSVIGSFGNCYVAQEMHEPIKFRSQGVYLRVFDGQQRIECIKGEKSPEALWKSANTLAHKIAEEKGLKMLEKTIYDEQDVLRPKEWAKAPKMFRFHENELWEMNCAHPEANFTFTQKDLKDCIVVDQGKLLWLWTSNGQPIPTFVLKVAHFYWYGEEFAAEKSVEKVSDSSAHLVHAGSEPDEFKALFVEWEENKCHSDGWAQKEDLCAVLADRLKFRSVDELRRRELPAGCDIKHLEQYLSGDEFEREFGISREQFEALPRWRQLTLKKKVGLF